MFLGCGNAYFLPKVEEAPEPSLLLPHNFHNGECARGCKQFVWWMFILLLIAAAFFICNSVLRAHIINQGEFHMTDCGVFDVDKLQTFD